MPTKIVTIDAHYPDEALLIEAGAVLAKGGLVIMPTETVYGIAANSADPKTIARLYDIKKRPSDKPFTVHIEAKDRIEGLVKEFSPSGYKLIEKFWPGPLTLIGKAKETGTIGIRLPDCAIAQRIIALSGARIVCPSANISGGSAPVTFDEAMRELEGKVDLAIDAGRTSLGKESTIVDVSVEPPKILRVGALSKEAIETAVRQKIVLFVCTGNSCRSVMAKGLLEKKLKEMNRTDVKVFSAGIMMMGGLGASEETRDLLSKEGVDVSSHRSQRVSKDILNKSDIILVMEKIHEQRILEMAPQVKKRLFLLKEFAASKDTDLDISDPMGKSEEFYQDTFFTIKQAVEKISKVI